MLPTCRSLWGITLLLAYPAALQDTVAARVRRQRAAAYALGKGYPWLTASRDLTAAGDLALRAFDHVAEDVDGKWSALDGSEKGSSSETAL